MRGMVAGEPIVSQAQTREFDEGYDRTFGPNKKPIRGKWVWDEQRKEMVPLSEYQPPPRAIDAPILAGRFYENQAMTDGTDVGSRQRYERYLREHNAAPLSDFKECGAKAAEQRKAFREGRQDDRDIREVVGRTIYELENRRK